MHPLDLELTHRSASARDLQDESTARPPHGDDDGDDGLRPARGILIALGLSLSLWLCILFAWMLF